MHTTKFRSGVKRTTPRDKRAVNLYLNAYLFEQFSKLTSRYGVESASDLFNEFMARELQEKSGVLRATLATRSKL